MPSIENMHSFHFRHNDDGTVTIMVDCREVSIATAVKIIAMLREFMNFEEALEVERQIKESSWK